PFDERLAAKIGRAGLKDVERDERCPRAAAAGVARAAFEVDPALEILKTRRRALRVERHDLTVEDDRLFQPLRPRPERLRDFRKLIGFLVAQPRPEMDAAAAWRDLGNRPDAVVLGFV